MKILRQLATTALVITMAAALPVASAAQSSIPDESDSVHPRWTQDFGEQLRTLLTSGDPVRTEKAMMLIMKYAQHDDLDIDFRPAIPALFAIYESGSAEEGLRLLALSTIETVGGEETMHRLADRVLKGEESSERVERQTLRILTVRVQERTR